MPCEQRHDSIIILPVHAVDDALRHLQGSTQTDSRSGPASLLAKWQRTAVERGDIQQVRAGQQRLFAVAFHDAVHCRTVVSPATLAQAR
jgi:hypothetical protein